MHYKIQLNNPLTHFFNVSLQLDVERRDCIVLELPTWRPGRYEAANYAKYIRGLSVTDIGGTPITYEKTKHSQWKVYPGNSETVVITYNYWAFVMDAGSSWYDEDQVYINFINCLIYDATKTSEACVVEIDLPKNYDIACGLEKRDNSFLATDYYELVDSPLMAAAHLDHYEYAVRGCTFHIWVNGNHNLNRNQVIEDFQKFTTSQIETFEEFPESEYHFLLQVLPYKFYHGVEHHDSTVICLGPGDALEMPELYNQLLGVSSHELFHAWNIIKIRPKELMPYDFNNPAFFSTGFVAEGFTTYYGDLFLARGGVFDLSAYFNEINVLLKRHFMNFGRLNYSIVDSSLDLWVDGYTIGAPDRKSSIYVEGAIIALCLDLMIRRQSEDKRSLDDVIRMLWQRFGKKGVGYTYEDILSICEEVYQGDLKAFFRDHVKGVKPKKDLIASLLPHVGCALHEKESENALEKYFGIRVIQNDGSNKVIQIAPGSLGESWFSLNDEILSVNQESDLSKVDLSENDIFLFEVKRNYKEIKITLEPSKQRYFQQLTIDILQDPSEDQKKSFKSWSGLELISVKENVHFS